MNELFMGYYPDSITSINSDSVQMALWTNDTREKLKRKGRYTALECPDDTFLTLKKEIELRKIIKNKMKKITFILICLTFLAPSCKKKGPLKTDWNRYSNPVFRDKVDGESYEVASDAHVFFDYLNNLKMIYSGDYNGKISIKIAKGNSWTSWEKDTVLLGNIGPSGLDIYKETPFYRKASNGKHQIYYIGYPNEDTYEAQIYLAESDSLRSGYVQQAIPIVSKGNIAGKPVYCMTSPSVFEHNGLLYLTFIGWDNSPSKVSETWILGATSSDDGHTWSNFQEIETKIGMEGQVTKAPDGTFYSVYTSDYKKNEGIFISHSNNPFTGWTTEKKPILLKAGAPYEVDETIAPQLIFDPVTGEKRVFYTGADYKIGWWIMTATEK